MADSKNSVNSGSNTNLNTFHLPATAESSSINNTKKQQKKKKPALQRNPSLGVTSLTNSPQYIYSVDDDLDEIEQDLEREYLEGYNDALRYRYKKSSKNLKSTPLKEQDELTSKIISNLIVADTNLRKLDSKQAEPVQKHHANHHHQDFTQLDDELASRSTSNAGKADTESVIHHGHHHSLENPDYNDDDGEGDHDGNNDSDSIHSIESFTLRERQDAINTTHPFGIRIWKPALYKKTRSVEREADKDIHEEIANKKQITWSVHITNLIWTLTFGLFLFILISFGAILLTLIGDLQYAKVFFNLGIYLLWPFGKIVYLQKDENYLDEDRDEGTTIGEYQRWRDEEHHKLFFSPSNSNLDSNPVDSTAVLPNTSTHPLQGSTNQQRQPPYQQQQQQQQQESQLNDEEDDDYKKKRFFGRGDWSLGRIIFYIYYYIIIQPILYIIWLFCWLLIVTIPMAKVISVLTYHLRRHPLAVFFKFDSYLFSSTTPVIQNRVKNSNILVCTYRSSGLHYWKYTVDGTNIFLINLLFIVLFTIFDFYVLKDLLSVDAFITNESIVFALCLLSIVPLAYFIGQAVASISAQSSMGVGAVINAFFSTIVEIYLYCVALHQNKGLLVEGSMIGSILGGVLLLPGLSMCAGAFIRKTQRYNPASAGVSSTMLLFSISVMFAPTVFHQIYGTYEIKCSPCPDSASLQSVKQTCQTCNFFQPPLKYDHLFDSILKPFSIVCALLLFLAYTIGLWFTLRTHAALIWQTPITDQKLKAVQPSEIVQPDSLGPAASGAIPLVSPITSNVPIITLEASQVTAEEPKGHDAPNWSKNKSTLVLLFATLCYAIIAEILVDCVDSVLKAFPINPKFLGITIFALVPNTTEFLNAISFATHGNVALSMEIGSAYALQVCLIQIPSLVLFSLFFIHIDKDSVLRDSMFTLIFPKWDLIATIISVVLFTYIYAEGKSNYFKGSILILIYVVVLVGFWFTTDIETSGGFAIGYQPFTIWN